MNVVVVVMDSLRADHIYGSRARTASWDKVGRQGVRFLNAYPEGMPTIPARRAIMSGKRTFPFRGWRPRWKDLPRQPGWEPVGSDGEMWTATLREAGWTTGYVTDNPHLLLPVHRRFRAKFDRVELVEGQVPVRRRPPHLPSRRELDDYLPEGASGHHRRAPHGELPGPEPTQSARAGLQRGEGLSRGDGLDRVGPRAPAAVCARGRLVRRARALGRAAAPGRHVRPGAHRRRPGADPAVRDAGGALERHPPVAAAAAPHAAALRRRGHARGRVARALPRPAREPRPGRQHAASSW